MVRPEPVWIVASIENNRTNIALRFLTLGGHTFYAPRANSERHRLLFSPYIFVEMINGQYRTIRCTPGVRSVVLRGDSPAIVPHAVITALKCRENRHGTIDITPRLRRGMKVQITTGPFAQYEGMLTTDPSQRVSVLFQNILGAPREISFPHAAVAAL